MKIKRNSEVKLASRAERKPKLKLSFGKVSKGSVMLGTSLALLALISIGMICPMVGSQVFASCTDGTNMEGCSVARATVESEVTVGTSISLAVDNKAELDLIPNSRGATGTMGTVVRIATNSQDGYALFMQAQGDGSLKNTTIVAGAEDKNIESTKQAATLDNLDLNTYGYYLGKAEANSNTTYSPMNTAGTEAVITTDKPTIVGDNGENYLYGDNYNLSFGVKVGTDLPAGTYTGEVLISAVANPETIRSLAQVTYMQDMQPEICVQTAENYTKQLIDTRANPTG